MIGVHDLPLFVVAGLLLNITPGPDMAYIAARSASGGFRDGVGALVFLRRVTGALLVLLAARLAVVSRS